MTHPKKKWGQNFLRNRGAVERIVAAIEAEPEDSILEIGPGEGALTFRLAELGHPLIAIEIDPDLAHRLRARLGDAVEIREEDAVEAALPTTPYRAVGNLPYNVGTVILRRVISDPHCRRAVFMLQKEVAERLVAAPRTDSYGYLTLFVRVFAEARILMTLEPRSFHPPPKVRSAVVILDPVSRALQSEREVLLDLLSMSFRMRRKKLVNNLIGWRGATRETVETALDTASIDRGVRAEELGLVEFDRLANAMAG